MRACEEEEGSPKYQVARFQAMAPTSPAKTTAGVATPDCTMPSATVAATASERKAPTKFRTDARPTATRGGIARVEIEVATALAVSWNPLVKSNASAVATTIHRTASLSIGGSAGRPVAGRERGRQVFLMTMPSRMFAACSVESIASSRRSKMSFQRITSMGSIPRSNSDASASRTTRSPSFSSRLTSTV
jgi:hypothetical protein